MLSETGSVCRRTQTNLHEQDSLKQEVNEASNELDKCIEFMHISVPGMQKEDKRSIVPTETTGSPPVDVLSLSL